jgi:hypothetical protein
MVKAEKEYELEVKSYLLMAEENEEVDFSSNHNP